MFIEDRQTNKKTKQNTNETNKQQQPQQQQSPLYNYEKRTIDFKSAILYNQSAPLNLRSFGLFLQVLQILVKLLQVSVSAPSEPRFRPDRPDQDSNALGFV